MFDSIVLAFQAVEMASHGATRFRPLSFEILSESLPAEGIGNEIDDSRNIRWAAFSTTKIAKTFQL
jgi:hypothetical protein